MSVRSGESTHRTRWVVVVLAAVLLAALAWTSCVGPDPVRDVAPSGDDTALAPASERRDRSRTRRRRDPDGSRPEEGTGSAEPGSAEAGDPDDAPAAEERRPLPTYVDGVVLDDDSLEPVPGTRVEITIGRSGVGGVSQAVTTGSDGTFLVKPPVESAAADADQVELVFSRAGYEVKRLPATGGPLQVTLRRRRSDVRGSLRVFPDPDAWTRAQRLAEIELSDEGGRTTRLLRRLGDDGSIVVADLEPGPWRVRQARAEWRDVQVVGDAEVRVSVPPTTLDLASFAGSAADLMRQRIVLASSLRPDADGGLDDPLVVDSLNRVGQLEWAIRRKITYRDVVVRGVPEGTVLVRLLGTTPHLRETIQRAHVPADDGEPAAFDAIPVGAWTIELRGKDGQVARTVAVTVTAGDGVQELVVPAAGE